MKSKNFAVFLAIIAIGYIIINGFLYNGVRSIEDVFTNNIALENVYYLIQITTSFALIVGAIIGVWQYVLTSRSESAKINNDRIQKAIDLAEYYKR